MTSIRLAVVGMGKMGRAVSALAAERGFQVVATLDAADMAGSLTREALGGADVAIEFTVPEAAPGNIRELVNAGCPVVVGTTGWHDALPEISAYVREHHGALLWAPNFSIGVNLFQRLVTEAARLFGAAPGFDAHLIETHHSAKKDAPSGTAISLERAASAALGRPIPITSIRTGSVPGTHELLFDSPFETVRLEHVARDRRVFAEGALMAARWLVGREGVFEMKDVLDSTTTTSRSA
ncbi:MAG TPA: dihydrodipicolinate reductase C-terminal domain-containing protein [Gemmatimonadaceae bacterium]|nr:dihydrodipicolinate reductase C-terminal domain-containing protein [Gemmatimonadaceae bacterium]